MQAEEIGIEIGVHTLRATAATNALEHEADIAKMQDWLGQYSNDADLRSEKEQAGGFADI